MNGSQPVDGRLVVPVARPQHTDTTDCMAHGICRAQMPVNSYECACPPLGSGRSMTHQTRPRSHWQPSLADERVSEARGHCKRTGWSWKYNKKSSVPQAQSAMKKRVCCLAVWCMRNRLMANPPSPSKVVKAMDPGSWNKGLHTGRTMQRIRFACPLSLHMGLLCK